MKDTLQFGDLLATRSNSFLSRAIRWFMKRQNPEAPNFSHIAVVIDLWGEIWIAESLGWGQRLWSLEQSGYDKKEQVVILRHKKGFSQSQIKAMSQKMVSLGGVRYQYENLPAWAIKILTKINLFKKENEKAIYCSELGCIAINAAYPLTFLNPNMITPADHFATGIYDVIDPNGVLSE
jgi:hypothetical protein